MRRRPQLYRSTPTVVGLRSVFSRNCWAGTILAAQPRGGGRMRIPAFVALLLLACAAQAQPWPSKPVRVVIPWPPGQATDIATRLVGQRLQEVFGQPFVMDNKPGAGGTIGTDAVAKAAPDGYTLLGCSSGPMSVAPNVQKTPYDPLRDFAPLAVTNAGGYVLVTRPSFPATNARDLLALMRANPGKYSFSSSGQGSTQHLVIERSEEHTSELQSRFGISYAVFCLKK